MKISITFAPDEADVQNGPSLDRGSMPEDEATRRQQKQRSDLLRMLVVINFILQLLSAILGQFNSLAPILMILSHTTLLLWISVLMHRFRMETVIWKWRGIVPLPYSSSPTNTKPFFSFADIVGLLSTVCLSIITALNFFLFDLYANGNQIQISGWLNIIFAYVMLCSTFWGDGTKIDQSDNVPLHSVIIDESGSEDQKIFTLL